MRREARRKALAESEAEPNDVVDEFEDDLNDEHEPAADSAPNEYYAPPKPTRSGGVFTIYKRNQGKNTRIGTAVGAGIIIGGLGWFLYDQLEVYNSLYLQTGVAAAAIGLLGLLTFWLVAFKPRSVDFLIATDSELKKVNWSTRKEVIGSTKVVIVTTVLLAVILFVVDLCFLRFFQWIGVWEVK
jgi:preprotein translocase subunit SecE